MAGGGVGKSRLDGLSVVCAVLALFLLGTIGERLYIKVQTMARKYTQHINYEQAPIVRPYLSALCHCQHLFLVMVSSCGWHRCSWHLVLSPSPDNELNHQIAKFNYWFGIIWVHNSAKCIFKKYSLFNAGMLDNISSRKSLYIYIYGPWVYWSVDPVLPAESWSPPGRPRSSSSLQPAASGNCCCSAPCHAPAPSNTHRTMIALSK